MTSLFSPHGRADTDEKKRAIVERILAAWQAAPELRLGQLIANAVSGDATTAIAGATVFYVEDERLAHFAEQLAARLCPSVLDSQPRVVKSG